jgi:prolyl 4-hydroxylase
MSITEREYDMREQQIFTATVEDRAQITIDTEHTAQVLRQNIDGNQIYLLRQLMTPSECRALIEEARRIGFTQAGLAIGDEQYRVNEKARNNKRVIIESRELAQTLWRRAKKQLNQTHEGARVVGLNERFRIYQYEAGQYFAPHYDLRMKLPDGESRESFMIYLNENFEGGTTRFFEQKPRGEHRSRKRNNHERFSVKAPTGGAVVFDHLLLHEGSAVTKGIKYAVRTDVVYGSQ